MDQLKEGRAAENAGGLGQHQQGRGGNGVVALEKDITLLPGDDGAFLPSMGGAGGGPVPVPGGPYARDTTTRREDPGGEFSSTAERTRLLLAFRRL